MAAKITLAIIEILGIMGIGALARRLGYIRNEDLDRASKFVIDFLLTALVFTSVVANLDPSRLNEMWILPTIGLGLMVSGGLLGFVLRRPIVRSHPDTVRTFHHFCAINNYVFLPLVILQSIWGDAAAARLFLFNLGSTIGFWTVGVALLSDLNRPGASGGGMDGKPFGARLAEIAGNLRHLLTPSLIALVLAIIAVLTGLSRYIPQVVLTVGHRAGSAAVPCMLILVGATMVPLPRTPALRMLGYITVLRLVVLPAIFVPILWLLPLSADVRTICCVVAIMPASISSAVITRRYGGDPQFAAATAMVTTLLSAATAPLWLMVMDHFHILTG